MDRKKLIAIITGAIALILSLAYLLVVQLLDFRGEMVPAPIDLSQQAGIAIAQALTCPLGTLGG
ncbi:hypothetical protein IFO70_20545 [Phormidium tenue FACHB-886]|nr:hypothetical protein [Phormidium tenue FACHB-886]